MMRRRIQWECAIAACYAAGLRSSIGAAAGEARAHLNKKHADTPRAGRKARFKTIRDAPGAGEAHGREG